MTKYVIEYERLIEWAEHELENGNRLKASKINKIAIKLEETWEKHLYMVVFGED